MTGSSLSRNRVSSCVLVGLSLVYVYICVGTLACMWGTCAHVCLWLWRPKVDHSPLYELKAVLAPNPELLFRFVMNSQFTQRTSLSPDDANLPDFFTWFWESEFWSSVLHCHLPSLPSTLDSPVSVLPPGVSPIQYSLSNFTSVSSIHYLTNEDRHWSG